MNNSKSSVIGFALLFALWIGYLFINNTPSKKDREKFEQAQKHYQDSLALADSLNNLAQARVDSLAQIKLQIEQDSSRTQAERDSLIQTIEGQISAPQPIVLEENTGAFATASTGTEEIKTLENDKLKVSFSNKGGRIVDVEVKGFMAYDQTTPDHYDKIPLHILNHARDKFDYFIPINGMPRGGIRTQSLYFEPSVSANSISFKAFTEDRLHSIEQKYTIKEGYVIDYELKLDGINQMMPQNTASIELLWHTHLGKVEKNAEYERRNSTIHYKETEGSPNYCNCAAGVDKPIEKPIQWISHMQQFFNTSLIATGELKPTKAELTTIMSPEDSTHLKELVSKIQFPVKDQQQLAYQMQFYVGPNEYKLLAKMDVGLERIIPFGWSIFGVINRHVIRPMFNFFATFIPNYGIIILLLTLLIRLALYPLQFKMLQSSVKMSILRPELDKMKERLKDDQQAIQMEQMKLYQEYGVNPLGGCLPMLLTMPIWIALYRFFPASIEFRQKGFLWADDLVSYDSILDFGFSIPFYGDHLSLFTLLWAISMFAYLIYNGQQMDMGAAGNNPNMKMMKYMQYAFPVIFFFALNSWASGLTAYMLCSNVLNIAQTYITKNFVINKDKLKAQMDERRKNPKAKKGWQQRYEDMLKQQQEMQKNKK